MMLSRRSALGGIGGLAATFALPGAPEAAAVSGKPARLRPGDTVGLIEPAGFSDDQAAIDAVRYTIEGMGLVPRVAPHVGSRYGYLAGTDEQRASDIDAMFADPEIRAVFAVRGGWAARGCCPCSTGTRSAPIRSCWSASAT